MRDSKWRQTTDANETLGGCETRNQTSWEKEWRQAKVTPVTGEGLIKKDNRKQHQHCLESGHWNRWRNGDTTTHVDLIDNCQLCDSSILNMKYTLQMYNRLSYCASNVTQKSVNLASLWPVNSFLDLCFPKAYLHITELSISYVLLHAPDLIMQKDIQK